jgi:hypothetical protein
MWLSCSFSFLIVTGKQLIICHKALEVACDILKETAASIFRKCVNAEDRYTNDGSCMFPKNVWNFFENLYSAAAQ